MSNREFALIIPEKYQDKLYRWGGGLFSTSYEAICAAIKENSNQAPLYYKNLESFRLEEMLKARYEVQKLFLETYFYPLLKPSDTLLDIGCAEGEFTLLMSPYVKAIWAYDFSPSLIRKAQQNLADSNITNITFTQGDICAMEFQDTYRVISFMGVLSYLLDFEQAKLAIKKLYDILEGGGIMVYKDNTNATNEDYYFFGRRVDYWMVARSREKYISLFKEVGFRIICNQVIHRVSEKVGDKLIELESYMCILQKD